MKSKNIINEDLQGIGSKALKVAGKVAKWAPVASIPLAAQDVYARQQAGDITGAAIAGASALPIVGIPADVVQAARDKYRTGSFLPEPEEIQAAVEKEKKEPKAKYDPGFLPESLRFSAALAEGRQHRKQLRRVDNIYEELRIYKLHYNRHLAEGTDMSDVMFVYVNEAGVAFDEQGDVIAESKLGAAIDLAKRGWQGITKNVPPAYRAVKSGIGRAAGEIGDVYQGVKKTGAAIGSEIVDVPTAAAKKLKGAYQDIRYGTEPSMDPAQRLAQISDYKSRAALADLDAAEVARQKGLSKADIQVRKAEAGKIGAEADAIKRQGKAAADVQAATARDIAAKTPLDWKPGKKAAIGTAAAAGVDALAGGVDIDPDQGVTYEPGRGIRQLVPKLDEVSLWDYMFGKGDKDKPKPPKPVPPAAVEPTKPEKPAAVEPEKPAAVEPTKPEKPAAVEPTKPAAVEPTKPAAVEPTKPEKPPAPTGSDRVRAMQQKLAAAGYGKMLGAPGVDGKWGKRTQAAYDAYTADKKLKQADTPNAASLERERIAAQSNQAQAPAGTNVDKIDVDALQKEYPRAAAVTEPVTRSTPWGGIKDQPADAIEKVIQAGQRRAQDMARIQSQALEPVSKPALNTNSVPYAVDQEATDARDRLAARLKEDLQDMLRLSGLQGK